MPNRDGRECVCRSESPHGDKGKLKKGDDRSVV